MVPGTLPGRTMLAAAALLAGCDRPVPAAAPPVAADNGIDAAAIVRDLPAAQRDAVMLRAIRDAGRDCQGVTGSEAAGEVEGDPAWTATCRGGGQWLVILKRGGIATVTNLADIPR